MMQLGKGQSNSVAVTLLFKWGWVHYLHGSSSSGELICLAQGQHGASSATVIDPMTSRFGFPCFTTLSPRSLFILCLLVCLLVCLNWCLTSQSKANGHVGTLPRVVWDFYQKLGRHGIQIKASNITTKRTTFLGRLRPERLTSNQMVSQ